MVGMYTLSKDSVRVRNKNKDKNGEIRKSTPGIALRNFPMNTLAETVIIRKNLSFQNPLTH